MWSKSAEIRTRWTSWKGMHPKTGGVWLLPQNNAFCRFAGMLFVVYLYHILIRSIPCPSGIPPSDIIVCFPIISYHCSSTHRNSSLNHLLQDHIKKDCQSFPISCALCDETGIPRGKLKEHHDPENGDCEGSKAVCPFRQLGCQSKEVIKIFKELIRLKHCWLMWFGTYVLKVTYLLKSSWDEHFMV